MEQIKIPDGYQSALNLHDTQIAIKNCERFFFSRHYHRN